MVSELELCFTLQYVIYACALHTFNLPLHMLVGMLEHVIHVSHLVFLITWDRNRCIIKSFSLKVKDIKNYYELSQLLFNCEWYYP